jgi:hypothetical protein
MVKRKSTKGQTTTYKTVLEFVTRITRQVPLVEQELFTLPEHLRSPPVFSGVHVIRVTLVSFMCHVL